MDVISALVKVLFDDASIENEAQELQTMLKAKKFEIVPQIKTASLKSEALKMTDSFTKQINASLGTNLSNSDVFGVLRKQINASARDTDVFLSKTARLSKIDTMERWCTSNSKAMSRYGTTMKKTISEYKNFDKQINNAKAKSLDETFAQAKVGAREEGLLGKTNMDKFSDTIKKFGTWTLASGAFMTVVTSIKSAVKELKEVDTILTEISKTSEMTTTQLKELGNASFEEASKYGKKATDYLTSIQEMNRSGFYGQQGVDMAEQSIMAQSAGDMTEEIADRWILATNAAYGYLGNFKKINTVLDGVNEINTMVSPLWKHMAS